MLNEDSRVLLLGGTGAMGVNLVNLLTKVGIDVFITSRNKRESSDRVHYIEGNAKDIAFLTTLLNKKCGNWDVIIDFMAYSTEEFTNRYKLLLNATRQYVFISSARVYSQCKSLITEDHDRLLDVIGDEEYLKTDEYALAKARQENILHQSGKDNWTIIRPSITYDVNRLQLGVLEKENWLYRALHGRSIVFSKDIEDKITTMTYGKDVASGIVSIMGKEDALGKEFHITENNSYRWQEILEVYLKVLENKLKHRPKVIYTDESLNIKYSNKYQVIYCRYYDRSFDNTRIKHFMDTGKFIDAKNGLEECLSKFLENPSFRSINWALEAAEDMAAGEFTPLYEINGVKNKIRYLRVRFPRMFGWMHR